MRIRTVILILKTLRHIIKVLTNIETATTNLNEGSHLYLDKKLEVEIEYYNIKKDAGSSKPQENK